jgi:hypothetical protein
MVKVKLFITFSTCAVLVIAGCFWTSFFLEKDRYAAAFVAFGLAGNAVV